VNNRFSQPLPEDQQLRRWLRRRLVVWFRANQRDLPWRRTRDPYAIWLSEIMLQQTQVATVIPYYQRFLDHFPTLNDLARADEQQVLRCWEGLGYYRRVRSLHRAAQILAEVHQGKVPNDPEVLRQLPGLGRYTVGAVLSQAYDRRLPILEANSLRLLCRFFGLEGDPRAAPLQERLWEIAERLLPRKGSGEFNQALMELGALVCSADTPKCLLCPLRPRCGAYHTGRQEELPQRPVPPAPIDVQEVAVVVQRKNGLLLVQRPEAGRWGAMWEFPHGPRTDGETPTDAAKRLLPQLTGLEAIPGPEIVTVRHGVTRFRITLVCLEATYKKGEFKSEFYQSAVWVGAEQLHLFPLSSPQRQIANVLRS
jgi:A/G-specific adenine glycosylase